jgi:hypothetical protein
LAFIVDVADLVLHDRPRPLPGDVAGIDGSESLMGRQRRPERGGRAGQIPGRQVDDADSLVDGRQGVVGLVVVGSIAIARCEAARPASSSRRASSYRLSSNSVPAICKWLIATSSWARGKPGSAAALRC